MRILIILDGLDEARRWSQERRALLEKLMGRPAVIITSRSHDTDMLHLTIDLHLEALGLNTMSVDAYLDNTRMVSRDTATKIHRFIEHKPFVKDMVRVPIHLDILCYSWDELHGQNEPIEFTTDGGEHVSPTITALYQAVVRSLWRKDIPTLDKLDQGESVNVEIINAVRDTTRLERLVHIESNFLEEMANNLMKSDRLEFTDNDIAEAIRRLESKGKQLPLSLERNLQKLSLLRSYPTVGHQKYRFVHLTFQEFFTARYLARQVARDRASFEAILRQHKYNRRYEIVWMFFAGLLTKVDESEFFFNLLDEEPRDLVGIQHIQLFMYCLSECPIRIRPSHWDEYQRRLADWLRLETRIARRRGIGSSMAFPENILREQLHSIPPCSTKTIMRTISDRNSLSKSFIEYIDQLKAECSDKSLFCWVMPSQYALKFSDKFNFTTMRILAQRSKLSETTASLFMEQIRSQSNPESYAYKILMWQRHLPDKAIEDLVEWLEDPRLSGYVDQLLGSQTALSKETIDCAIEKLTGPLGYWDIRRYRSSVCLRQDLHAEAVGKVLDFLENAALRSKVIPDRILLDLSRMHLLQSDVERLGNLIKRRLCSIYKESKDLAVKALGQQANLSTNVLKIFVKLLRDEHSELFRAAQQILQKQPALHDDIIDKLRDLFKNDKGKVPAVLKERLQLPPKAMKWLVAQTTEAKDADIRCRVAVDYLLGQSDLPDYLVNSFPELIEDGVDFKLVAKLLGQQREPSDEVVNRLLGLVPFRTEITALRVPEIIKKDAFADPLIEALEQAGSEEKAKNVGHLLRNTNLDQASVKRLRSLMNTERLGNNERDNRLAMMRSEIAYECMLRQVKLDRETILDLHAKIHSLKSSGKIHNPEIGRLWNHRHIEQFCTNLAVIDSKIFPHILPIFLRVFLHRLVEDLTSAYIDGKTLYFYAIDGNLTEQCLEDEEAFRKCFREAQRRAGVPEWALIKLPEGRREKDPYSTSYSAIF